MSTTEEIRGRMRVQFISFVVILVLAMMAAATVYAEETRTSAVFVIAAVQALIVLNQLMHAFKEGPWIRWLLAFCALFVAVLAGILYLGYHDTIDGTQHVVQAAPAAAESQTGEH